MMPVAVNGRLLMITPFGMSNQENLKIVQLSMSKLENLEEENQNSSIPQEVNKVHIF